MGQAGQFRHRMSRRPVRYKFGFMKKKLRRLAKVLLTLLLVPLAVFFILVAVLYIPAVQDAAVREATGRLSASLAMDVSVERVRLSFPLDLSVEGVLAREGADTLLSVGELRVDVPLLPLLRGRADLNTFTLRNVQVDTKHYVADTRLSGTIGSLTATT